MLIIGEDRRYNYFDPIYRMPETRVFMKLKYNLNHIKIRTDQIHSLKLTINFQKKMKKYHNIIMALIQYTVYLVILECNLQSFLKFCSHQSLCSQIYHKNCNKVGT